MADTDPGLNENHLRRLMTSLHLLQSAADRLDLLLQPSVAASSHEIILDTLSPVLKDLVRLRL